MANIVAWQFVFLPGSACKLLLECEEFPQLLIYNTSLTLKGTMVGFSERRGASAPPPPTGIGLTVESFLFHCASSCVHHLATFVLRVFVSFKIVETLASYSHSSHDLYCVSTSYCSSSIWSTYSLEYSSWISYTICLVSGLLSLSIASSSSPLTSTFQDVIYYSLAGIFQPRLTSYDSQHYWYH